MPARGYGDRSAVRQSTGRWRAKLAITATATSTPGSYSRSRAYGWAKRRAHRVSASVSIMHRVAAHMTTGRCAMPLRHSGCRFFNAYQNVFNPVNMMALAPSVSVRQGKTTLTGEVQFTWRATTRDAIYRANDLPYAGTQLGDARHTGNVWQVQLAHNFTPRLSILGRYEHLSAGKGLTDAGYASSDYFTAWLNFRF